MITDPETAAGSQLYALLPEIYRSRAFARADTRQKKFRLPTTSRFRFR